jgi:hypothetical protein
MNAFGVAMALLATGAVASLGSDSEEVGVFTTLLAATVPLGLSSSVAAAIEPDDVDGTLADVVVDRAAPDFLRGVASASVVSSVVSVGVEAVSSSASDDASEDGVPEVVSVSSGASPDPAGVAGPVAVEAAVDPGPFDVWVPVEGPVEVFEPIVDESDEFGEAGLAHATP